jgi:hypothetical protein
VDCCVAGSFTLRFWVFCGAAERCTRYVSPDRLVKATRSIRKEAVPVPDELRQRRHELGFNYGKFDFVLHQGKAILLDANKNARASTKSDEFACRRSRQSG